MKSPLYSRAVAPRHVTLVDPEFDAEYHLPGMIENSRDGSVLRLVSGDEFAMSPAVGGALSDKLALQARVPAFYIAVHAVSNEQFARFLAAASPEPGQLAQWLPHPEFIVSLPDPGGGYRVAAGHERDPATSISWLGAEAYARWVGLRLPSEIEWERATAGAKGRNDELSERRLYCARGELQWTRKT